MVILAVLLLLLIVEALWVFLSNDLKKRKLHRKWRAINAHLFLMSIIVILLITLFTRKVEYREPSFRILDGLLSITMLRFVSKVKLRHMALNFLLFVPIGLTMPFAYRLHRKYIVPLGFLMSLFIECTQHFCLLGRFEVDDLLMNTLGVVVGAIPYFLYRYRRTSVHKRILLIR